MSETIENIPSEESHHVEFKSFLGGVSVKEISITLCAFANTEGGVIYIGVTDSRQIQGVSVTPSLLDQIQNAAREGCSPAVPIKLKRLKTTSQKYVVALSVEKSGRLHSVASGQTYVRVGTQDKRVLGEELLRLAETKSQVSYEEQLLDAGMEIIDVSILDEYCKARVAVSAMRGGLSLDDFLIKIGLAKRDNGRFCIKAGAFILFGKEKETLLLQRDFVFVKYDVEGKMYSYREDLSLPAVRLFDRLIELIRPHNRKTSELKGLKRQDLYVYPEEAVREALLNAFAHRDYHLVGLRNECRIYPDRMEIISAGCLPGPVTLKNIDTRHYSRNPKIMHALMILGLTEELGQGISLIKKSLKLNGNPAPEFLESPDQFKVVFKRPKETVDEKDFQDRITHHLSVHTYITRTQIEALCGIKPTRAKYLIVDLLKAGVIDKEGNGPSTRYKIKGRS